MKAIIYNRYGGPEVLESQEIPDPKPKSHEVLIKVESISLNPVDAKARQGGFKPISNLLRFPRTTGTDFSGAITEIGKNVSGFKVGDSVYGWSNPLVNNGSASEMLTISEKSIALAPNNINLTDVPALPCGALTSLIALRDLAPIRDGHKILINGSSGGTGTMALQVAKIFGGEVTAVTSSRNSERIMNDFEPDHIIDYTKNNFIESNNTYDVIFDVQGNKSFNEVEKCLTANGIYITTQPNIYNSIDFAKSFLSRKKSKIVICRSKTSDLNHIRIWVEEGKIKPVIEKVYEFDQFKEAYEHLATGRVKGKLILKIN
jgi:NADPH:quinone reductase-like Zn-dependent oxidoreductase|tara:strand:- start:276 stop:1226 length:951 start_codon:yes stop_codon:yes gene_type:complete